MNATFQITFQFDATRFNIGCFLAPSELLNTAYFSFGAERNSVVMRAESELFTEEDYLMLSNGILAILRMLTKEQRSKNLLDYQKLSEFIMTTLVKIHEERIRTGGTLSDSVYEKEGYLKVVVETKENSEMRIGEYLFKRSQLDSCYRMYEIIREREEQPSSLIATIRFSDVVEQENSASARMPVIFAQMAKGCELRLWEDLILYCTVAGEAAQDLGSISKQQLDDAWALQLAIWKFVEGNCYLSDKLRNRARTLLYRRL